MVDTTYLLCGLVLVPLVGAATSALWRGSAGAHWPATVGVAVAWVCAGALCVQVAIGGVVETTLYTWLHFEQLKLNLGLVVDPLSATVIATITTVALATLLYHAGTVSRGSTAPTNLAPPIAEGSYPATVGFLVCAALLTATADSYLLLYVGWEGVAVSTWLLMGWRTQRLGATTFAVQRLGSAALLLSLLILLVDAGSVDFGELATLKAPTDGAPATAAMSAQLWTTALVLLAVAAAAQAAQFPLHFWLADGSPEHTPTSAMVQAGATVPIGLYLAIRSHHLLSNSTDAAVVTAAVALAGALLMGLAALAARDLDRVLAYSTSSQAGLVIAAAVSTSGWSAVHLMTHSLTKGALILAAGLVARAVTSGGELAGMGGLRSRLPLPFWVFVASVAVLSGLPPLTGAWSQAGIALAGSDWATPLFSLVALLTSLGLWRALWLTFLGKARSTALKSDSGSSTPMANVALIALSGFGVVSGFLAAGFLSRAARFAAHVPIDWGPVSVVSIPRLFDSEAQLAVAAIIAAVGLLGPAIVWLVRRREATVRQQQEDGPVLQLLAEGYYGSEMFEQAMRSLRAVARVVWTFVDSLLLDLVCARGLAGTLRGAGWIMARFHSGHVAWYGLAVTTAAFMCALWLIIA